MRKHMATEYFTIDGMTCMNCRDKIVTALSGLVGVNKVSVNGQSGWTVIEYEENRCNMELICQTITKLGYRVITGRDRRKQLAERTTLILTVILVLFLVLDKFDILNLLVPSRLADDRMGYGILFGIGVLTSFHCIAMCGGIQLSQILTTENRKGDNGKQTAAFLPVFSYNLGRIMGYTLVGMALGGLSSVIGAGIPGAHSLWQAIFKSIVGIFMVICAMNLIGLFPGLRKIRIPVPLLRCRNPDGRISYMPFIIGMMNSLMPCGPLQSMWVVALGAGSTFAGGMVMLAFAAGTVPVMLGAGTLFAGIGQKASRWFMNVGAVLVAVMGLAMFSQGAALSGKISQYEVTVIICGLAAFGILWNLPLKQKARRLGMAVLVFGSAGVFVFGSGSEALMHTENKAYVRNGIQYVESELTSGKYPDIKVASGLPVQWTIHADAEDINGCNYEIYSRELGIEHEFTEGDNVIEFTPEKSGVYEYTCWMGMIKASIAVE